jgi:predicted nucleotide-binding protein
MNKEEAIAKLQRSIDAIGDLQKLPRKSVEFEKWRRDTEIAIERIFGSEVRNIQDFKSVRYQPSSVRMTDWRGRGGTPESTYQAAYIKGLDSARVVLQSMVEEISDYWSESSSADQDLQINELKDMSLNETPYVFIGHGRSTLWARLKIYIEDELDLAAVSYESESRVGDSIVPVLERMLDQASFAVLILTAEDETAEGSKRARQNVVHEAGLFQGRLGFKKAVLLVQEGLEGFSNIAGLQYIPFSGDRIDQTFYELQRALKREGLLR